MEIIRGIEQGSEEWLAMRRGVITGTRLSSVVSNKKSARLNLIAELIAELIAPPKEKFKSEAMERGNIMEGIIKDKFPEYEEVTFITKCSWIGVSPDAVKFDGENIVGALEIKSPEAKNFVLWKIEGEIPSDYIWQVVQYFLVIPTLEYLEFAFGNPEVFDPNRRLFTLRVTREQMQAKITEAQEALKVFKIEWDEAKKKFLS